MVTEIQDNRVTAVASLYDWQTDFFKKAIEGISDADSHKRLDTKANHIAWLAGSLVQQRFELANVLTGSEHKQQADALFRENQGIKEDVTYPSLTQYRIDWERITPVAGEALRNATTEKLDSLLKIPGMEMLLYDYVLFAIYREANCIGQIALWRRLLGYDAMKYM